MLVAFKFVALPPITVASCFVDRPASTPWSGCTLRENRPDPQFKRASLSASTLVAPGDDAELSSRRADALLSESTSRRHNRATLEIDVGTDFGIPWRQDPGEARGLRNGGRVGAARPPARGYPRRKRALR